MEEVLERFPKLGEKIFEQLDDQNLSKCIEVHKTLRNNILDQRIYWIRRIRKGIEHCNEFAGEWRKAVKKTPIRILKKLAAVLKERRCPLRSPLHVVALSGDLELFYNIEIKFQDKNPKYTVGGLIKEVTLLHSAADNGYLAICQFIIEKVEEKNPKASNGVTPLHNAASNGHLAICRLIVENVVDKNPKANNGVTPLHNAARKGFLDISQLIVEKVENKNPGDNNGVTPLHDAARYGHLTVCQLIVEKVEIKNPGNNNEVTPLDNAARYGHLTVCQLIVEKALDKNPRATSGVTTPHAAGHYLSLCRLMREGRLDVVKYILENPRIFHGKTPVQLAQEKNQNAYYYYCKYIHMHKKRSMQSINLSQL